MKKIFSLLLFFLIVFPFAPLSANYNDDRSFYLFYLEERAGVLGQDKEARWPYDVIPGTYAGDKGSGDYYGEIVSGKKVALARFWFDKPSTVLVGGGKSVLEVRAPYFANADHITFYNSMGTSLFSISVAASSFCNDNGVCNEDVGENGRNCPNDCPLAPEDILPDTLVSPGAPPKAEVAPTTPPPAAPITSIVNKEEPSTNEGVVTRGTVPGSGFGNTAIMLTIGVFLILLSIVGWIVWRRRAPSGFN